MERAGDVELVPDTKQAPGQELRRERDHLRKRRRRKSGTTVTFDPVDLKKYVTGFRKRKLERKEHAKKKIAELEKKAKRIKRKQKEQELKERCGMGKHDKWLSSSDSEAESDAQVKKEVYTTSEYRTVVNVQPMTFRPSESFSEGEPESSKAIQ